MSEPEKMIEGTSRIATLSAGIEGINQAVRALYAYKVPATYKDLAQGAGLHPVYMSQSLSASRDIGLATSAGKRGLYKLTELGTKYALYLSYGENDKAKNLLGDALQKLPNWSEIIKFLRMSYRQERTALSLVADVEGKLGKHWTDSLRNTYASSYTSVLKFAGLLENSGNNIVSQIGDTEEQPTLIPQKNANYGLSPENQPTVPVVTNGDYSEFSIPESFKVFVRKDIESLTFFETQVMANSIFMPWITHEKRKVENLKRETENRMAEKAKQQSPE